MVCFYDSSNRSWHGHGAVAWPRSQRRPDCKSQIHARALGQSACQIVNYWSVELKDMSSVCRHNELSDCYWVCKVFHILDNIWHPSDELYNFRCYVLRVSFHNYFQHQPFKIDWPTTGSEKSRKPPNYIRMVSILQDNDSRS